MQRMKLRKKIRVHVVDSDIEEAVRGRSDSCPVALAVSRTTGWKAKVDYDGVILLAPNDNRYAYYNLPNEVGAFMSSYDAGVRPKEIKFTMVRVA